jgi:DUF4097 and DUF4098 domain-containing protein YvlB
MLITVLAGVVALGMAQQMDTTLAVRPGARLAVEALGGSVTVRVWDRDAVRIRAAHDARTRVEVDRHGDDIRVVAAVDRRGAGAGTAFDITVPRSFSVAVDGVNLSASIEGVRGTVVIDNIEGDITVRDVTGDVTVSSVSGRIVVDGVAGAVSASSVSRQLQLSRVRGDIRAETTNGSIIVRAADAARVHAATVNGLIEYDGTIRDGGSYVLATHNGRITMTVPQGANASFSVSARSGRVEAGFPVSLSGTLNDRFAFTLGTGSARVEIESFNGAINLVRPARR